MANEQIIKAWVLQLGLDLEPVAKGVKKTEDMLRKLERVESRTSAERTKALKTELNAEKKITSEKKRQESLSARRLRVQTSIQAAERRAVNGGLTGDSLSAIKKQSKELQDSLRNATTPTDFALMARKLSRFRSDIGQQIKENNQAQAKSNALLAKEDALIKAVEKSRESVEIKRIRAQTAIQAIERRAVLGGLSGDSLAKIKENSKELQDSLKDVSSGKEFANLARRINVFSTETSNRLKESNAALAQRNALLAAQARISDRLEIIRTRARMGGISPEQRDLIGLKAQGIQASLSSANSEQIRKLAIQTRFLNEETSKYIVLARKQKQAFSASKFAISAILGPLKNLAAGFLSVYAIINSVKAIHGVARELDSLKSSLLAASGSAQQAGEDFKFIISISKQLGVSLSTAAAGYRQIGAAGRQMGWESAQIQDTFLAATEAARAFGLNADRTGYVYLAFSQMLSKGKVSQEELRRQLGEHLPGAMNIAAKAMGVTVNELDKMIQVGISAEEFVPKFSAELRKAAREGGALASSIEGITAAEQRLSATLQQAVTEGSDMGYRKGVVTLLNSLNRIAEALREEFALLIGFVGGTLELLGEGLNIFGAFLSLGTSVMRLFRTGLGFSNVNDELKEGVKHLGLMQRVSSGLSWLFRGLIGTLETAIGKFELFTRTMSRGDILTELMGGDSKGMQRYREILNRSRQVAYDSVYPQGTSKSVQVINHNTFTGNPEQNAKKMESMFQNWLSYE